MSDIREQIAKLSPAQRQQFLQRLQQEAPSALELVQHIPRRADPTQAPLSFAQQRMWLLDQLEPGNPLYTMTPTMRLTGPLDVATLERGLNTIVQRHEALRATVSSIEGRPVQVIAPQLTISLPLTDLRDHAPDARETIAQDLLDAQIAYHFDLASGPLICARLLRLADDDHILMVTMHHLVSDGWSLGVLIRELVALYVAQTTNRPAALAALPIQYADFAAWQRVRLQGAFLDAQLGYWRQQLADVPVLQLPTDYVRPAIQAYRSANLLFTLAPTLTDDLKALSRRAGTTLFMTQLAVFATLLGRLSGQTDFCIGSLVAGRNQPELEGLIGFFVNNLALRLDLRGQPSAEALLRQVRAVTLGAYDHQDVPFELVLEAVQPTRTASHSPLFQTMCVMQNFPRPQQMLPGLVLHPLYTASRRSGFDLTFWFWEEQDSLAGELEYNPTLFEPATIQRIVGQLRTLLTHFVATPERSVSALPLLTEAEREQLLVEWNATATAYPADECLHTLFERQVARTPDAIALVYETNDERRTTNDELSGFVLQPSAFSLQLTYAELNRRANRLAHRLQALGVGPETLVGLCVERSLALVVGLLGILKAGGAYVPLDRAYPTERLAFMLHDARVAVVLTQSHLVAQLPAIAVPLVCLDDATAMTDERRRTIDDLGASDTPIVNRKSTIVNPDNLAYVIYTSGSTGTPKGTLVSHANVARLLAATQDWFGFDADDVWTLFHSYAFDFSVWELWGALAYGGRLVLVPYWVSRAPSDCWQLLRRERVSVLNQTPSAFRQLLREAEATDTRADHALRLVIFGGEALELRSLHPWFARHGDQHPRLVNMYGITETTVHVTYRALRLADLKETVGSPIGEPIPDLQVYVLDPFNLEPMPLGVAGELYVSGAGLARGYLNRADLTAERFVPNPFAEVSGIGYRVLGAEPSDTRYPTPATRLYRTGDRARYLAQGGIEYLGRLDQQVKLRGFRIELGEIAATLRSHAAVRECIVLVREETPGDQRLVAYVVQGSGVRDQGSEDAPTERLTPDPRSLTSDLRSFLATRLPEYMVPSAFVLLAALPLTPSGKIDQRALPAPDQAATTTHSYMAPRTPVEEVLAEIWADVLGLVQVSVTDNFFDLGGHSLLIALLIFRLRETFQVELPLRILFEQPTIMELAVLIEELLVQEIENLSEDEVQDLVTGIAS